MDDKDLWFPLLGVFLFSLFIGIYTYGCYRLGQRAERKEFTTFFIKATEETYFDGRHDAERDCREGLIK